VGEIDLSNLTGTGHTSIGSDADGPAQNKINKAAEEFEGMLISSLWKSMGEDMKDSSDTDSINSSFTDMGLQAVSSAMAKSGGIGVGRILLKALEKQQAAEVEKGHGLK
jgi:Rod binding domain-containing protein